MAIIEQRFHQKRNATNLKHVFGNITAARLQIGDIGCLFEDFGDVEQIEFNAALVGDGRQVQRSIGRSAGGGDDGGGVLQRLAGDNVARTDV